MLSGILKKKNESVALKEAILVDKTVLNRRVSNVLSRSTRHALNPPTLSPEDYYEAGYAVLPETAASAGSEPAETVDIPAVAEAAPGGGEAEQAEAAPSAADMPVAEPAPASSDNMPADEAADEALSRIAEAVLAPPPDTDEEVTAGPASGVTEGAGTVVTEEPVETAEAPAEGVAEPVAETETRDPDMVEPAEGTEVPEPVSGAAEERNVDETVAVEPTEPEAAVESPVAEPDEPAPAEADDAVPVVEKIYVSADAMNAGDPAAVAEVVLQEMEYLMFDAGYKPEELPHAAIAAWCANFFVSTASQNGVGRFAHEAIGEPDLWQACSEGLEAAGAAEHRRVYEDLRGLLAWDAGAVEEVTSDPEFGENDPHMQELDAALRKAETDMPIAPALGAWLKSRPEIEVLDHDALQEKVTAVAGHPALVARKAAWNDEAD